MVKQWQHVVRLITNRGNGWKGAKTVGLQNGLPFGYCDYKSRIIAGPRDLADGDNDELYAVWLHEIGHSYDTNAARESLVQKVTDAITGHRQVGPLATPKAVWNAEVFAWEWAERNAISWSPAMSDLRLRCLDSYQRLLDAERYGYTVEYRNGAWVIDRPIIVGHDGHNQE